MNTHAAHGFIGWYYTSAQDNTNIDDAMNFLVRKILDVAQSNKPRAPEETVVLSNESQDNPVDVYERQEKATCCS
jgi:hypothetical protein